MPKKTSRKSPPAKSDDLEHLELAWSEAETAADHAREQAKEAKTAAKAARKQHKVAKKTAKKLRKRAKELRKEFDRATLAVVERKAKKERPAAATS